MGLKAPHSSLSTSPTTSHIYSILLTNYESIFFSQKLALFSIDTLSPTTQPVKEQSEPILTLLPTTEFLIIVLSPIIE